MNGRSIYIILQYMLMLARAGAAFDGTCFPFELVVFPRQLLGCFWLIVNWLWGFSFPLPPFFIQFSSRRSCALRYGTIDVYPRRAHEAQWLRGR